MIMKSVGERTTINIQGPLDIRNTVLENGHVNHIT